MRQTSVIFGALFVAFLVFITLRGELAQWLGVVGLGKAQAAPASPASPGAGPGAGLPAMPALPPLASSFVGYTSSGL